MPISIVESPFIGAATGLPMTTAPSTVLCLPSGRGLLAGLVLGVDVGDDACSAARCNAAEVVSAAARSSATNKSSNNTPVGATNIQYKLVTLNHGFMVDSALQPRFCCINRLGGRTYFGNVISCELTNYIYT